VVADRLFRPRKLAIHRKGMFSSKEFLSIVQ
jgi:hypothetical protein